MFSSKISRLSRIALFLVSHIQRHACWKLGRLGSVFCRLMLIWYWNWCRTDGICSSNLMEHVYFFIQSDGICATMIVSFGRARRKCATANLRTQKSTQIHGGGNSCWWWCSFFFDRLCGAMIRELWPCPQLPEGRRKLGVLLAWRRLVASESGAGTCGRRSW